jgi:hypothetical protein
MKFSHHAKVRMAQRGIPHGLVGIARKYVRIDGDRWVLDRRTIRETLGELAAERALLMPVMDKGRVAVAEDNDTVITVFNLEQAYQRG